MAMVWFVNHFSIFLMQSQGIFLCGIFSKSTTASAAAAVGWWQWQGENYSNHEIAVDIRKCANPLWKMRWKGNRWKKLLTSQRKKTSYRCSRVRHAKRKGKKLKVEISCVPFRFSMLLMSIGSTFRFPSLGAHNRIFGWAFVIQYPYELHRKYTRRKREDSRRRWWGWWTMTNMHDTMSNIISTSDAIKWKRIENWRIKWYFFPLAQKNSVKLNQIKDFSVLHTRTPGANYAHFKHPHFGCACFFLSVLLSLCLTLFYFWDRHGSSKCVWICVQMGRKYIPKMLMPS